MTEITKPAITAAILVIGDEILSGRTKDKNIGYIAEYLTNIGIDLKQVRVVQDDEADIIEALSAVPQCFAVFDASVPSVRSEYCAPTTVPATAPSGGARRAVQYSTSLIRGSAVFMKRRYGGMMVLSRSL